MPVAWRFAGSVLCCAVVAAALAGCAARDTGVSEPAAPASLWQIAKSEDRITGSPSSNAIVRAAATHTGEPFPQPAMLQLSCFKNQPIARIGFSRKVGSTRNAEVAVRFDEKPGRVVPARFVEDYRSFVIEDPAELAAFVRDLTSSKLLYVRVRSLTRGNTSVEFHLEGAVEAAAAGYASCPIKPPDEAKSPARKKRG